MNNTFRRFVTAVDNYPFSMAVATVGTTTMTGVVLMKATDFNPCIQERRPLLRREAHFLAMIEDAKKSTWRENLETAAMAQEQALLVQGSEGDRRVVSRYLTKINSRAQEILQKDQEFWKRKTEYDNQEKAFATTTIW